MDKEDKFEYNLEDYKQASEWLKTVEEEFYNYDGWSLVLYANDKYKRLNKDDSSI